MIFCIIIEVIKNYGADIMSRVIKSKDVAEIAVIELMNGLKTKIAFRNEKGDFELKTSSLITQYLNPNNNRKKMTERIAEALGNNFEYYLLKISDSESYYEMCGKAVLFIYGLSGVDLTYIFDYQTDDNNSRKSEMADSLIFIVREILKSLVRKDEILDTELENIVYTNLFGACWNVDTGILNISYENYFNYIQSLNTTEINNFDIEELSEMTEYITELINADNVESFSNKHGVVLNRLTNKPVKGKDWKKQYLLNKYGIFGFKNKIKSLLSGAGIYYLNMNAFLQNCKMQIDDARKNNNRDEAFLESEIFKEFLREFDDSVNMIQLQARIDKELAFFGCYKSFSKKIGDDHELINEMMKFLFNGVCAKIGFVDEKGYLKEVWRDCITKYVNGEQIKFTKTIKQAIFYRVKYHFEYSDYFEILLWQFMYYVFGIDFYMLRNGKNELWLHLVDKMLDDVVRNYTVQEIKEHMQMIHDKLKYETCTDKERRLAPNKLLFFRHLDSVGFERYTYIYDNILSIDGSFDTVMTAKYLYLKIDNLFLKLDRTVAFIEKLFKARTVNEIIKNHKLYHVIIDEKTIDWKRILLCNMCDEMDVKIMIEETELKELELYLASLIIENRFVRGSYDSRKEQLRIYVKKIIEMNFEDYKSLYGSCKNNKEERMAVRFNRWNKELLKSDEVCELYNTLKNMLDYLVYSEWLDENIQLT